MVLWYTPEHTSKHEKDKGKSPNIFKTHRDEIVIPLTKKKYLGQTPRAGHGILEEGAGPSSRIITTRFRLGTSATRDVPSPEGKGRIRAYSASVLVNTGTRAPPSTEVLAASLSSGMEEVSTDWVRTDCRGNSGRSLEVLDPSPCATAPSRVA